MKQIQITYVLPTFHHRHVPGYAQVPLGPLQLASWGTCAALMKTDNANENAIRENGTLRKRPVITGITQALTKGLPKVVFIYIIAVIGKSLMPPFPENCHFYSVYVRIPTGVYLTV